MFTGGYVLALKQVEDQTADSRVFKGRLDFNLQLENVNFTWIVGYFPFLRTTSGDSDGIVLGAPLLPFSIKSFFPSPGKFSFIVIATDVHSPFEQGSQLLRWLKDD